MSTRTISMQKCKKISEAPYHRLRNVAFYRFLLRVRMVTLGQALLGNMTYQMRASVLLSNTCDLSTPIQTLETPEKHPSNTLATPEKHLRKACQGLVRTLNDDVSTCRAVD